jgi:hypothetical protein
MRFREFLTEIENTPRQGLIHFQAMKPIEALFLFREMAAADKKLKDVKTSLKVDGLSARFGKDENGKFFFESGRSGPISRRSAFATYTINKGGTPEMVERAIHYDDIYDLLETSDLWQDLPNDTKIICEILYNPMAQVIEDNLKFISIHYPKSKLGNVMTIVPISVIGDYDMDKLYEKTDDDIKIVSAQLGSINVDLDIDLSVVDDMDENVLLSRKKADRERKLEYVCLLQELKDEIGDQILKYPITNKDRLGPEIEGIVVELNGKNYKITTDAFKDEKRAEKLARKK